MENVNLTDHFLIAMPNMVDPFFAKTLTYICEHNERGALGLVINRPTDLSLEKFFDQLGIPRMETFPKGHTVLFGGPVQIDSGFVLHRPILSLSRLGNFVTGKHCVTGKHRDWETS